MYLVFSGWSVHTNTGMWFFQLIQATGAFCLLEKKTKGIHRALQGNWKEFFEGVQGCRQVKGFTSGWP